MRIITRNRRARTLTGEVRDLVMDGVNGHWLQCRPLYQFKYIQLEEVKVSFMKLSTVLRQTAYKVVQHDTLQFTAGRYIINEHGDYNLTTEFIIKYPAKYIQVELLLYNWYNSNTWWSCSKRNTAQVYSMGKSILISYKYQGSKEPKNEQRRTGPHRRR